MDVFQTQVKIGPKYIGFFFLRTLYVYCLKLDSWKLTMCYTLLDALRHWKLTMMCYTCGTNHKSNVFDFELFLNDLDWKSRQTQQVNNFLLVKYTRSVMFQNLHYIAWTRSLEFYSVTWTTQFWPMVIWQAHVSNTII